MNNFQATDIFAEKVDLEIRFKKNVNLDFQKKQKKVPKKYNTNTRNNKIQ